MDRRAITREYFIYVTFRNIQDRDERRKFLTLPTRFALDDQQVGDLIAAGRRLVTEHPQLRRLIDDLN